MSSASIGVVVGTHARNYLDRQLAAIRAQTVRPACIHVWHDGPAPLPKPRDSAVIVAGSRQNLGVWTRFFYATSLSTDFVCIFDDDTIPGPRWFESCLDTHRKTKGLVGAAGVRFPAGNRSQRPKFGWPRPSDTPDEVDVIGHCWFLPRNWLAYFVLEPRMSGCPVTAGEDYHLSFSLQKHLRVRSFTCPHSLGNLEIWGSLEGQRLGNDQNALWNKKYEHKKKQDIHDYYLKCGWKLVSSRQ